jgi:hypothetical protein
MISLQESIELFDPFGLCPLGNYGVANAVSHRHKASLIFSTNLSNIINIKTGGEYGVHSS